MSFRIGKTKVDKTMVYLMVGILALAFVVTNVNTLNLQAQYTIFNEITATSYVYSDDGNMNVASNAANEKIKVKVVLDDIAAVTSVSASIYDLNNNHMGVTANLVITSADSYETEWVDVAGLPNGRYLVICQVLAGGVEVNQPADYEIAIKHPARDMSYTFVTYKDDVAMGETDVVAGLLKIKLDITTGSATDGSMYIYRGTKDIMFDDKIASIIGLTEILAGYTFDGDNLETGDYWAKVVIIGSVDWLGFEDSIAINLQNVMLDPITSDVSVYTLEDSTWTKVPDSGILHDTIKVTANVLTGTPIGYVMEIENSGGTVVKTCTFIYDETSDIWKCEFDTKSLANGDYSFNIKAIKSDGVTLVPQSSWSTGIWTPSAPGEESNMLIWIGAFGAIGVIILFIFMKKRSRGY